MTVIEKLYLLACEPGQNPDTSECLQNIVQVIEEQDRKLKIMQGLCQEQTKRIDENRAAIAGHSARISNMITQLENATANG